MQIQDVISVLHYCLEYFQSYVLLTFHDARALPIFAISVQHESGHSVFARCFSRDDA